MQETYTVQVSEGDGQREVLTQDVVDTHFVLTKLRAGTRSVPLPVTHICHFAFSLRVLLNLLLGIVWMRMYAIAYARALALSCVRAFVHARVRTCTFM